MSSEEQKLTVKQASYPMEHLVDDIRRRYGHQIIQRGVVLADRHYAVINPKEQNTIHPVPFFAG